MNAHWRRISMPAQGNVRLAVRDRQSKSSLFKGIELHGVIRFRIGAKHLRHIGICWIDCTRLGRFCV